VEILFDIVEAGCIIRTGDGYLLDVSERQGVRKAKSWFCLKGIKMQVGGWFG
jgi:hypothetical protein